MRDLNERKNLIVYLEFNFFLKNICVLFYFELNVL